MSQAPRVNANISSIMGVPLKSTKSTNRHSHNYTLIGVLAAIATLVILQISACNAENEQYWYYKELERLKLQVNPPKYNLQEQQNKANNRRAQTYHEQHFQQFPQLQSLGVMQQPQRQEPLSHGNPQHRILQIENTKYSIWSQNMTYHSSTGYNALGMAPLYNLTNKLIDVFVDAEEPIPPGKLIYNK